MNTPKVKVCGVRSAEQAVQIAELGADYIGMIFYERSPRFLSDSEARRIVHRIREMQGYHERTVFTVGVFVNSSPVDIQRKIDGIGFDIVQLAGDESPSVAASLPIPVIKTFRIRNDGDFDRMTLYHSVRQDILFLFDTFSEKAFGGTGKSFDHSLLEQRAEFFHKQGMRFFVAGGLNLQNLPDVLKLAPYGIDLNSGVEISPGVKDLEKVEQALRLVKGVG
jgi:phosphoribosylanthranilate isomerase